MNYKFRRCNASHGCDSCVYKTYKAYSIKTRCCRVFERYRKAPSGVMRFGDVGKGRRGRLSTAKPVSRLLRRGATEMRPGATVCEGVRRGERGATGCDELRRGFSRCDEVRRGAARCGGRALCAQGRGETCQGYQVLGETSKDLASECFAIGVRTEVAVAQHR